MPARLEIDLGAQRPPPRRRAGEPMRILLVGDFGGASLAERVPLADRPTHRVDLERLEPLVQRLRPRVLSACGAVDFEQLDDFHPDALFARLPAFDALRQARAQPPGAGGALLGQLIGQPAAGAATAAPAAPAAPRSGLDALLHQVTAGHVVADRSAETAAHLAAVDAAIAEQMRALLHTPELQRLEAAWRGLQWLLERLELDETLELHLFDATRDELLADIVAAQGRLAETGLQRALAERWRGVPGAPGWTLLVGLYAFGASDTDIGLLAALGLVASRAGGPWLAEADAALAAADDATLAGWHTLRSSEAAPWIGLATPRLLLRRPYGKASDPVAAFAFEEIVGAPRSDELLWGNPALAIALLAARARGEPGDGSAAGPAQTIDDLPTYVFTRDGERELQPCTERPIGEQEALALLQGGLMALLAHRDRNALTVLRLQSIAQPPRALAGL
ncbi:MAG: type VI secretion system contractile sheath large subunit [Rubrivivax sp.]